MCRRSESTLKRHGYYCRSRKAGNTSRPRSCISCARAKARCNNGRPECSRCLSKAFKCHYPPSAPRRTRPSNPFSDDAPTQQPKLALSLVTDHPNNEYFQEEGNVGDLFLDPALNSSDLDLGDLAGEFFNPNADFAAILNPQTNDEGIPDHSPDSSSLACRTNPWTGQVDQVQQALRSPNVPIAVLPTYTLRSFHRRSGLKTGPQRIADLIFHTLKSYPLMMLHENTLPPFIHPHWVSSDVANSDLEPLTNCMNLVHMLNSQIQGGRKLFWKNVQMECEVLYADVR